jgi:uncharacterized protein (TIGR02118 family)
MFKMIILAKRKPGMSMEAFREYYETRHAPLAMSLAPEPVAKYIRNYLTPAAPGIENPYDVVTETWFESKEQFDRNFAALAAAPEKMAAIAADEENFFDRSSISFYTADEVESDFG